MILRIRHAACDKVRLQDYASWHRSALGLVGQMNGSPGLDRSLGELVKDNKEPSKTEHEKGVRREDIV